MGNYWMLQDYFTAYLRNVRGLSDRSIGHYYDALNLISRFLCERHLIQETIFEVADLSRLEELREILYKDREFVDRNSRGHHMYSAGMNNYLRFAEADEFFGKKTELVLLDKPMPVTEMYVDEHNTWKRSAIIREQVLEAAEYRCEIDPTHKSFVVEHTNHQYAEGHHVIALNKQDRIPYSLDIYANIICLCPVCHRLLHYGSPHEKKPVAKIIYDKRANRLAKSGIKLSQREFENLVL